MRLTIVTSLAGKPPGAAGLPMQDPDAAAYVGTDYPFPLDDPCLDDLYRTFVALDVPLFLHPFSAGAAGQPTDPRLRCFDLELIVG